MTNPILTTGAKVEFGRVTPIWRATLERYLRPDQKAVFPASLLWTAVWLRKNPSVVATGTYERHRIEPSIHRSSAIRAGQPCGHIIHMVESATQAPRCRFFWRDTHKM